MKVKKEIRRRVMHRGVNALAARLNVTPGHVSQVLSGKRESRRVSAAARGCVVKVGGAE